MKKKCEGAELQECIAKKAHELWEKDGCPQDRDLEYWLKAEKMVTGKAKR